MSSSEALHDEEGFVAGKMEELNADRLNYDMVQMALLAFSLVIIFSLYAIQRRREEQLEVAQAKAEARDRAKSSFLSSVSHDIRTPMNAIIGYIELAKRPGVPPETVKGYIAKMESSSRHLLALITDVLEMSRIESGRVELEPAPVDLAAVFSELGDIFAAQMAEKNLAFDVDVSRIRHRRVMCDRSRLGRILLNLVGNACKFTPAGGRISVSIAETPSTKEGEATYEIRVRDNGLGMSREFIGRVFDPFERERGSASPGTEGTGLGMPITKGIVELMKGTIEVESEKGAGTEFVIKLDFPFAGDVPDEPGKPSARGDAAPAASPDFSKMRVLIVEDNEINREIAREIVSQAGFAVDEAENGKIAVEKVSRGGPGFYDAVLMDVHMPVMDGYAATRTIRAMEIPGAKRLPIIALSANAFETDVRDALAAGMDAHIAKPIRIPVLLETIGRLAGAGERAPDLLDSLEKAGCDIQTALRETYMGDRSFYRRMLAKLPASAAFSQVCADFGAKDAAALYESSHKLKGLYASLGLSPLYAVCSEIVEIARAGGLDGVEELLARLGKLHGEIAETIRKDAK
ncbi:MAG: response regulator [Kiritimatiellae bacterium]|nr:response regulator [Kiritimatiellia bacterium]